MKRTFILWSCLWMAASALGQGTLYFGNRFPGGGLDAPVFWGGLEGPKLDNATSGHWWVAVLYASAPGGTLAAVGDPIPFQSGSNAGYWPGETRTIPGVPEGGIAQLQVRVFCQLMAPTFEHVAAMAVGDLGVSAILPRVTTGGASDPAPMAGLQSFFVYAYIPEPSTTALVLLGAVVLSRGFARGVPEAGRCG